MKNKSILDRWFLNIHKEEWHKLELRCAGCNAEKEYSPWLANVCTNDSVTGSVKLCDNCKRKYNDSDNAFAESLMESILGMVRTSWNIA